MTNESPTTGMLIVRQPLFNRRLGVVAYEIAYQPFLIAAQPAPLGEAAVAGMLLDTIAHAGLDNLVQDKKLALACSYTLLQGLPSPILPPDRVILQIPEAFANSDVVIERLTQLARLGYTLAVDRIRQPTREVLRLGGVTHMLKLSLRGQDIVTLSDTVNRLRGCRARLLANEVDSPDDLTACQRLGFEHYQGHFYTQPQKTQAHHLDASRLVILRSLARIQDPSSDFHGLGNLIGQDAVLSHKLLAIVNSPSYELPQTITSLEQAVAFIGLSQLRGWMTLLTMAKIPNKSPELTTLAMLRARMCELLAPALGYAQSDQLFIVGLYSVLDALLDMPMGRAVSDLHLAPEIAEALVNRKGLAGDALRIVLAYERCAWSALFQLPFKPDVIGNAYVRALQWAHEINQSIAG